MRLQLRNRDNDIHVAYMRSKTGVASIDCLFLSKLVLSQTDYPQISSHEM